jgi:hypothetical protein
MACVVNHCLAGDLPNVAADFRTSATGWAFHKQAGVDKDITRLRGKPPSSPVRPVAVISDLSWLARCHAIARVADTAATHLGPIHPSIFTKAGIERAIHTARIRLQALPDCCLVSLDLEMLSILSPAGVSLPSYASALLFTPLSH